MFCVYCGAKMHDKGRFCPQCGKPVAATQPAPAEEAVIEKVSAVEEAANIEEAVISEEIAPAEETVSAEEVTHIEEAIPAEETFTGEEISAEENKESVTAVAPEKEDKESEAVPPSETIPQKKSKKKGLAKKNLTSAITYIVSAAIVAGIGLFAVPKLIFPAAVEKCAETGTPETALALYKMTSDSAAADAKFDIAKTALENENYAYAAALFSELKNEGYASNPDITSYVDEAFGGRCRVLINGGKYNLAEADSTQISDALLSACVVNDTIVSKAKILSSEGKTYEAYEKISEVNTSAAYDSESYNIIVYNYAAELYNKMQFAETYDVLADATDEASVELRCSSAYHLANDLLDDKDYSKAIEMYEKADGYGNSAEKLEQCHDMLGLRAYNTSDYQTAVEHFSKSGDYKESSEYLEKAKKKLDEETYYSGWTVEGHATNYVHPIYFESAGEMRRISKEDDFFVYFIVTNKNGNANSITIDIDFTTPDGEVVKETIKYVNPDDACYASFEYENPEIGATGTASFTVTLAETGEVLGTFYFEIY